MATLAMDESNIIIGVKMFCQHKGSFKKYYEKMQYTGYNWSLSDALVFARNRSDCHTLMEGLNNGDIGIGAMIIADSLNSPEGFAQCKAYDDPDTNKSWIRTWIHRAEQRFLEVNKDMLVSNDLVMAHAM